MFRWQLTPWATGGASSGQRGVDDWTLKTMATLVSTLHASGNERAAHGVKSGGSLLQRLAGWFSEQRRYRRTLDELSALTDRELDDIGVVRGELEFVARRTSRAA